MKTKPLALFFVAIIFQTCIFSAGSYAEAFTYCIKEFSGKQLVEHIIEIKKIYPEFTRSDSLPEDRIDSENFYHASFYIKKENMIIYAIVNLNGDSNNKENTKLYLETVLKNPGTQDAKFYKLKQLSEKEKNRIIETFESDILNKLGDWTRCP